MSNINVLKQLLLVLKPDSPDRRIVCIEETDTGKGDVILSFYLWYIFNLTSSPAYMVGFRDTYGHYQNLGLKFDFNLLSMSNKQRFTFVEPEATFIGLIDHVQQLIARYPTGPIYMIVDDISTLLLLGEKIENIILFLIFVKNERRLFLVFGCWKHKSDESSKRLASILSHQADIRISLAPLATGFSNTATGTMRITSYETIYKICDVSYLYKLTDNGLTLTLNSETIR